jgi:glycosyltransferase involved in cell wall biosynthesis
MEMNPSQSAGEVATTMTRTENPLVSVVIIFLNAEKFLQEAIASVLTQTYPTWELILVNDGSVDASTDIAMSHARSRAKKIRYFTHEGGVNLGMSASRNLGIENSRGTYIAFLDADDVWMPSKLEEQVAILEKEPAVAMVYGPAVNWFSWTSAQEDLGRDFVQPLGIPANTIVSPPNLVLHFLCDGNMCPSPSGILVRRDTLLRLKGFEASFRTIYEDQMFYTKLCLEDPVFVAGECWYRYRQHPDQSCAVVWREGKARASRLQYLNWVTTYLAGRAYDDRIHRTLAWERWNCLHPFLSRLADPVHFLRRRGTG